MTERHLPADGRPAPDDTGATALEMLVAMTVMMAVMAAVTTGVVHMFRLANTAEVTSIAQSQVGLAVLRLDRQVRYATEINAPHVVNGAQHVEYRFLETGRSTCVQLRVRNGLLQQRSWPSGHPAPAGWSTLASGISTAHPFTLIPATDVVGHRRLRVALTAQSGEGNTVASRRTDVTFIALNTTRDSHPPVCREVNP